MQLLWWTLLLLSASLASIKNIIVKGLSGFSVKKREFFGVQALIFAFGSVVLIFVNIFDFQGFSAFTALSALAYGIMLIGAQWFYTLALTMGKTAICATIYSFGFVVPTLSGRIFWDESLSFFAVLGIITVFPALVISGMGKSKKESETESKKYIFYLIIAMLCSGGIGIVQKIHQKSEYANQKSTVILCAFLLGLAVSLIFFFTAKKGERQINSKTVRICGFVGTIYSICNLLNTYLAGVLDSAIFFPAINIGAIVISMLLGIIIYKEKLTKKDIVVLCLGAIAIALVNL